MEITVALLPKALINCSNTGSILEDLESRSKLDRIDVTGKNWKIRDENSSNNQERRC